MKEEELLFLLKKELEKEYNELYDAVYNYLIVYMHNKTHILDIILYKDEIENLIGIREHTNIINYVLNNIMEG